MRNSILDPADRRILAALQEHPEISIAELAPLVGLSQTPCWRRMKRLQETGVIKGRAWLLSPEALGLAVNVFAELKLKQHDEETLEALEARARALPQIVECFSMSGDGDYLLRVIVASVSDYEQLLKKVLLHLPGVGSVSSSFALAAVKVTTKLPLD